VENPVVTSYLEELRLRAESLPPTRREELLLEIRSHIATTLPPEASEAQVRQLLDRLGSPEEIMNAELDDVPATAGTGRAAVVPSVAPLQWRELTGLALLLLGGAVLPPVGYLTGGVLIGLSRRWSPTARVLLVALPAVIAMMVMVEMIRNGEWYAPADLVAAPRTTAGAFLDFGLDVLPYTAAQVLALIAVWLFPRIAAGVAKGRDR
jgi:hypothetical protein